MSTEILSARVVQAGRLVSHEGVDVFQVLEDVQTKIAENAKQNKECLEQLESMFRNEIAKLNGRSVQPADVPSTLETAEYQAEDTPEEPVVQSLSHTFAQQTIQPLQELKKRGRKPKTQV